MITWKLILLWILPCRHANEDGLFECGAHGKFEYCIDGIPGCVVGCHCHPGYYFDTETKICEPNTKLTQNYRRQYVPEPTRIQKSLFLQEADIEAETIPTATVLTTPNVIDEHVNDITKNADDLGDWLYNQFFKTIENQVINNTNKDTQSGRRSGHASDKKRNKIKLRARKKGKRKHKKRRKGIKGELLQIAEDDSLFESSYSSESQYDSSSSDGSKSYSSFEQDSDQEHGHKKILMINKKPKPQLPSFIFLPHMDTPFYPPIGLPPAPVMPMYPMIPVPPVVPGPPIFPYPGPIPDCEENKTVTNTAIPTTIPTTQEVITVSISTTTDFSEPTTSATEITTSNVPGLRSGYNRKRKEHIKPYIPYIEENPTLNKFETPQIGQPKLLQRLRQKMNNPYFKKNRNQFSNYMNFIPTPQTVVTSNSVNDKKFKDENTPSNNAGEMPNQENVNFKYLSQLIHKVNDNQTQALQPLAVKISKDYLKNPNPAEGSTNDYNDYSVPINARRMIRPMPIPRNDQSDDSYYSNLGLQIASLIRTIDANHERQFNIEIEKDVQKPDDQTFFNENAPRTFWERSVRSPLKYLNLIKKKYDFLKNSNELLFNIENKVETVASTVPTLSLQEIENMISAMENAQTQFKTRTNIKNLKPSSKTLDINLWPQEIKQSKTLIKSSVKPNVINIHRRKFIDYSNNTSPEILNSNLKSSQGSNFYSFSKQIDMHKINDNSGHGSQMEPYFKSTSTKLYFVKNRTEGMYPQVQNPNELTVQHSEKLQYRINPTALKNKEIKKYFFDGNNHYSFQNDVPIQYTVAKSVSNPLMNPLIHTPYFRHEINRIDYIE